MTKTRTVSGERVVELTDAGRTLLAEWDAEHTAVEQSR